MTRLARADMILEPFGLTEAEERCYRLLLRDPGRTAPEISTGLGRAQTEIRKALAELEDKGLVSRSARKGRGFVASPPDLALEVLFVRKRQQLERAREQSKALMKEIADRPMLGEAVTVVEGPLAFAEQCGQIQNTVWQELKWFDKTVMKNPKAVFNSAQVERMAQGVVYRTIYESSTWDAEYLSHIERYVAAGEHARVVEELPIKLMIADKEVALISLHTHEDDPVTGVAIIRAPGIVTALCDLFEATWAAATPFLPDEAASPGLGDTDRRILALMVGGAKDESIARSLALNPSTVRRHIKALMKRLGASTRFQAGLQAAKRGWL